MLYLCLSVHAASKLVLCVYIRVHARIAARSHDWVQDIRPVGQCCGCLRASTHAHVHGATCGDHTHMGECFFAGARIEIANVKGDFIRNIQFSHEVEGPMIDRRQRQCLALVHTIGFASLPLQASSRLVLGVEFATRFGAAESPRDNDRDTVPVFVRRAWQRESAREIMTRERGSEYRHRCGARDLARSSQCVYV